MPGRGGKRGETGRNKLAKANEWTVIATDVKDGTTFRFQFEAAKPAAGQWAA